MRGKQGDYNRRQQQQVAAAEKDKMATTTTTTLDMRLHRLEKKVARLRVARVATPAAFVDGGGVSAKIKKRSLEAPAEEEAFVPKQAPVSESKRMRRAEAHDRAWIMDFWIELVLILLGLNVGPLLFWYFAQRTPPVDTDKFLNTGTGFVDRNMAYLLAPTRYVRAATLRENLPKSWGDGVDKYAPLFALCASLLATAAMLWSKPAIVHAVKAMAHMRASPITHAAIAWAWLSDMTPSFRDLSNVFKTGEDLVNIFLGVVNWLSGPLRMLIGYIVVICFSHLFAGVAQAGALLYLLLALTGLEKWWETKKFSVDIPDPNAAEQSSTSGGGAVFGGGGGGWGGGDMEEGDDDHVPMRAARDNVFSSAAANRVRGGAGGVNATAAAAADNNVEPAVVVGIPTTTTTVPFVPPSEARSEFLDALNRGAFRANKFAGPSILAIFAAVKMAGAPRMKTRAGSIFAWVASGLVGLYSAGTIAMHARAAAPVTVQWHGTVVNDSL